jgi:arylsulfatase A-like enzyme
MLVTELRTHPQGDPHPGPIGKTTADSQPSWPVGPQPPPNAPNIVLIVLDDLGFAQLGCFGGLGGRIQTPHIDRLAAQGLRYQNFHTTALCSPSRAALLTGRNHHSVGVATIMERATGYPGYHGRIPKDAAMLPAVLTELGYSTMAIGKWHLAPDEHITPAGPFDRFPLGQGFERFYGFMGGETSQWEPDLWEDNHRIPTPTGNGYHLTNDLVDHAVEWIDAIKSVAPSKPFFTYLAFGAPHSPHHVAPEYIEPYNGVFDDGWDVIRSETLRAQIDLGIVASSTKLPTANPGVRPWSELSGDEQRLFARQMEVYAAMVTHTDEQIGRLLDHLDSLSLTDNTLVMLMSDNGASAEGGTHGLLNEMSYFNGEPESVDVMLEHLHDWGSVHTHPHYASGWAMAGNTPNRMYKAFVHEGGTRDPLIVRWPSAVTDPGAIRNQFHHIVDITPTLLDAIGLRWPASVRGYEQRPLEGTSFAYSFQLPHEPTRKRRQYFEMFAHRAIWLDGWKAVTLHWSKAVLQRLGHIDHELHDGNYDADQWELYRLDDDISEMNDLAAEHPDKLAELVAAWWEDAERYQVLPLDDSLLARLLVKRPTVFEPRDVYMYSTRLRLPRQGSPVIRDRSFTIHAEIATTADTEGVIVSYGGSDGGITLCILEGHVHFVSNFLGRNHYQISSLGSLPAGEHTVFVEYQRTSPHRGNARLTINAELQGSIEVERTNPVTLSPSEGLEIGSDGVSPVSPAYRSPFNFTGTIHNVTITTPGAEAAPTPGSINADNRVAMLRQ